MANVPNGVFNHQDRVVGLRSSGPPGPVRTYRIMKDKEGIILRDKAGNPILGKRLTLPSSKEQGFSGYARSILPRYRLTGLPDPKEFEMFSGLDFTPSPELGNHQSKLLKNFGRLALSLFYFYRYRSSQFIKNIVACFKTKVNPDSSPALKCGVFSGVFINR